MIVAVPHEAVAPLVPPDAVDADALAALGSSPIVNLHVHFDRRVLDEPFAAAEAALAAAVAVRPHRKHPGSRDGQLVVRLALRRAAPTSASRSRRCASATCPRSQRLLPAARDAEVLDFTATREPRATFRAVPGTARLRPGSRTSVPGLYLAGAWTDTGWPATMESAVRSGLAAAARRTAPTSRRGTRARRSRGRRMSVAASPRLDAARRGARARQPSTCSRSSIRTAGGRASWRPT